MDDIYISFMVIGVLLYTIIFEIRDEEIGIRLVVFLYFILELSKLIYLTKNR